MLVPLPIITNHYIMLYIINSSVNIFLPPKILCIMYYVKNNNL